MKIFEDFLNEKFKFKNGFDQDYTGKTDDILLFSYDLPSHYQKEGNTHGCASHAIKHLIEMERKYVHRNIANLKKELCKFLDQNPDLDCQIFNAETGYNDSLHGKEAIRKASIGAILNAMDMINDENVYKRIDLNSADSIYLRYIVKFQNEYKRIFAEKLKYAIDVEDKNEKEILKYLNKNKPITYISKGPQGFDGGKNIIIDPYDNFFSVWIKKDSKIKTFYKVYGCSKHDFVQGVLKSEKPINKDVEKALLNYT